MKSRLLPAVLVILLGLSAAQVIATIHVHFTNLSMYERLEAFETAGYLILPNAHVLPRLTEWKTALFGGLFFTLTVGAFLTLVSIAAAWLRYRALPSKKAVFLLLTIAWSASLVALNLRGASLPPTLYFLIIPPLVFTAASKWLFAGPSDRPAHGVLIHALPLLFLALLWASQMSGSFFVDVRDYLLLSHSTGTRISDFYYRYTLYPAETLKPLNRKLLRAAYFGHLENDILSRTLQMELLKYDFLPVDKETLADLVFRERDNELHLQQKGLVVLSTTLREFMQSPASWLAAFARETDRHAFFRKVAFISIITGFPVLLYLLFYGSFFLPLRLILPPGKSAVLATLLCLVTGISLFLVFSPAKGTVHDEEEIERALQSPNWRMRVAALKFIREAGLEAARYPGYRAFLKSSSIPEKYWLAGVLGASRPPETFEDLLSLLDDPSPTVVSAAFQALGKRQNPAAVPHILERIRTSADYYNQWNAYIALRALGWRQSRSQ